MTFPVTSDRRLTRPLPLLTEPIQYPPTAGWTWVNQGSATVESENRGIVWTQPAVGANNWILRTRAYTQPLIVTALLSNTQSPSAFGGHGLGFRSASGQFTVAYWISNNNQVNCENWSNTSTFSGTVGAAGAQMQRHGMWVQVEDNGTNLIWRYSATGETNSFVQTFSVGRTSFLTGGPTSVGWIGRDHNNIQSWVLQSWNT